MKLTADRKIVLDETGNMFAACWTPGDAKLVSAVPELLECVQQLAQIVWTQNGNQNDSITILLEQARAAIAKATE